MICIYYVIDRIENDIAVCETLPSGERLEIQTEKLPSDIKEGDIVKYENGFVLEKELTAERNAQLKKNYATLWKK